MPLHLIAATALILLAGCMPGQEDTPRPDAAERTACEAEGGTYAQGGILGNWICFRPTPDAGKSCTRATDCSAMCYADTRQCSEVTPVFGCFAYLDEQGQPVGICID